MICLPIRVEPVKPSFRISGCSERRCPAMPPVELRNKTQIKTLSSSYGKGGFEFIEVDF